MTALECLRVRRCALGAADALFSHSGRCDHPVAVPPLGHPSRGSQSPRPSGWDSAVGPRALHLRRNRNSWRARGESHMTTEESARPVAPRAGDGTAYDDRGRALSLVSRALVRLYKEQFGRGPETAHSYYVGPDTLICVLYDSLTPVERSMLQMGEQARLRDIRMMFQY